MSVVVAWEEGMGRGVEGMYSRLDWGLVQGVGGGCVWLVGGFDDDGDDKGWWWWKGMDDIGEERAWGFVGG